MSQITRDFWPENLATSTVVTPVAILREQAALLSEKTRGLVLGEIVSRKPGRRDLMITPANSDDIVHIFRLKVPALDDYRYDLLQAAHPVLLYPLTLFYFPDEVGFQAYTENEFIEQLKRLLSHEKTLNVIHSLIAQAES